MDFSQRHYHNVELSDHKVSEADKSKPEYLMGMTDAVIEHLVHEQTHNRKEMLKMRAMREGLRDPEEFAYITDNYGIGNSGDIKFTPVIKNRIDALIGILSSAELDWKISIGDRESIQTADIMKSAEVLKRVYSQLEAAIGNPSAVEQVEALVEKHKENVASNWKSVYEQNANNFLKYYRDDTDINLKDLRKTLMEDLSVVGKCAYRVVCNEYGQIPYPEVLIPENYYTERRRDQKMYKASSRGVYVRYLSIEEVLHKYGHLMSKDQKDEILSNSTAKHLLDVKTVQELETYYDARRRGGKKDPDIDMINNTRYVRVYEVEWIANNEIELSEEEQEAMVTVDGPGTINPKAHRQDRYQSIRIGPDIYLDMGKSDFVMRDKKNPRKAYLSFNGMDYEGRNSGEPYSITWKCKDIQDMTDIMYYHRDNLVANSGVNGSRMDASALPKFLGDDMMQRLMKSIALRKLGVEVYASSQDEGTAGNRGVSSDFRAGVEGTLLDAITKIIYQLDEEATKITGVTPQMMGIIEQRDAVTNVKTGIAQASIVMKNMYDQHDIVSKQMLTDLLGTAQISLSARESNFTGSFLADTGFESFTLDPAHFSKTNYNIHVVSSANDYQKLAEAKAAANALANTGSVPPLLLMKIIASDSLTQVFTHIEKIEGNNSHQMIQELQKQVDDLSKDNEKLKNTDRQYKSEELEIKREDLRLKREANEKKLSIEEKKSDDSDKYNDELLKLKKETVQLERDQLHLESGGSREVRNDIA